MRKLVWVIMCLAMELAALGGAFAAPHSAWPGVTGAVCVLLGGIGWAALAITPIID